jgi:anthranilate synthase/indole-3-glycerol phosphate synthase/phosphoribosylanthranilate isomerase
MSLPIDMPESKLSSQVTLPPGLESPIDILLIDNFDSFTWNLYQSLCLIALDLNLKVIQNDALPTLALPLLKIKYLIISPDP